MPPSAFGAQRPDAGAAQVAVGLALERVRALGARRPRARVQVVREAALEVLVGVLAVVADVDVDRLPPVAGRSCRRRACRRRPRAARRRPTRRRRRTRLSSSAGEPLLGLQARARGVAGRAELGDEARRRGGLGEAEAVVVQLAEALEELVAAGAGRQADADAARPSPPGLLGVRRVGRDRDLVAGGQHVELAVQLDLHRALDHGVVLGHADVDVRDA